MKERNYTDHKVKLLFISGMILVFIILFTSFLYSKQSLDDSGQFLEIKSLYNGTSDLGNCLNETLNYPLYSYIVNPAICLIKNNG